MAEHARWGLAMGVKYWIILIGIFGLGVGMPMFLAYQLKLGEFAKSPQTVHLNMGGSMPVAGGRAKVWYAGMDMGPVVEISCQREQAMIELREDEPSQEVCGIQAKLIKVGENTFRGHSMPYVDFEVSWREK